MLTIKPTKNPDTIEKLTLFTLCVQIKLSQKFPVPSAPKQKISVAKKVWYNTIYFVCLELSESFTL